MDTGSGPESSRKGWTVALFFVAVLALNRPILGVFDRGAEPGWLGLPPLILFLYAAWAALIVLVAVAVGRRAGG